MVYIWVGVGDRDELKQNHTVGEELKRCDEYAGYLQCIAQIHNAELHLDCRSGPVYTYLLVLAPF